MKVLAKKMSSLGLLKVRIVIGVLSMAVGFIGLPVGLIAVDATLLLNPYVLGVVIAGMLFFGSVGYFLFIRPYFLYRELPDVLAETDGEFLYIHLPKKEAKIPLNSIEEVFVDVDLPFIYQKEFVTDIIIHLFSEEYGTVYLEIPNEGKFKMRFVSQAQDTADELISFMQGVFERARAAEASSEGEM